VTIKAGYALVAVFILLGAQGAFAAAMQCSGEEQKCIALCPKFTNPSVTTNCVTNCRTRRSVCMRTGCWDNGHSKYCGLARR